MKKIKNYLIKLFYSEEYILMKETAEKEIKSFENRTNENYDRGFCHNCLEDFVKSQKLKIKK